MAVRIMPQSLDSERAILGSVLLDNPALFVAMSLLSKSDFYGTANQIVFEKMVAMSDAGRPIDPLTVCDGLGADGTLDKVGGADYISALPDGVPIGTQAGIEEYCRIVKERSIARSLITSSENVIAKCLAGEDPRSIIDLAQETMFSLSGTANKDNFRTFREILRVDGQDFAKIFMPSGDGGAIPTGLADFDALVQGFHPGELVIVAARPSTGKTALALTVAMRHAVTRRAHTCFASIEMNWQAILSRAVCSEARIDSHRLRIGFVTAQDMGKVSKAYDSIVAAPFYIKDGSLTPAGLRAMARKMKAEGKCDSLWVDYIQLISVDRKFGSRNEEVGYISKSLKAIATELNIPVVALSQLSRAGEGKKPRKPILSDLRDSGSLEQDADTVLFLHRDDKPLDDEDGTFDGVGRVLGILAKQRNGPTGEFHLAFMKKFTRFENLAME